MSVPMATTTTAPKVHVILNSPSDWDEWFDIVKGKARNAEILEQVNVDLSQEPTPLALPEKPLPSDVKEGVLTIDKLTADERETFKLLRDEYKTDLTIYHRQRAALNDIYDHIKSTLSRQNHSFILHKETPYQMLVALKKRLAPTDRARKLKLSRRYQELKQAPRSQQVEKWLQQWEKTYTECKILQLAEVQEEKLIYDFILIIKNIDPAYATSYQVNVDHQIKLNQIPTIFDVVEDY
jgi:hypothetical protein